MKVFSNLAVILIIFGKSFMIQLLAIIGHTSRLGFYTGMQNNKQGYTRLR